MVSTEDRRTMKLNMSSQDKSDLETIASQVGDKLGSPVSMTWVIKTLIDLATGSRAADCFPEPPTYSVGEKVLLSRMSEAFMTTGMATLNRKE